jgi:nicotinamidase-related amidase
MAGNLGYDVFFVTDATHTFDLASASGDTMTADELTRATVINLSGGGFATVVDTAAVLA